MLRFWPILFINKIGVRFHKSRTMNCENYYPGQIPEWAFLSWQFSNGQSQFLRKGNQFLDSSFFGSQNVWMGNSIPLVWALYRRVRVGQCNIIFYLKVLQKELMLNYWLWSSDLENVWHTNTYTHTHTHTHTHTQGLWIFKNTPSKQSRLKFLNNDFSHSDMIIWNRVCVCVCVNLTHV